jgi:hypothetical protein
MKFEGLTVSQLELWDKLYGLESFDIIAGDMTKWLDKMRDRPSISRKKNWRRFICNWLKREQERIK